MAAILLWALREESGDHQGQAPGSVTVLGVWYCHSTEMSGSLNPARKSISAP